MAEAYQLTATQALRPRQKGNLTVEDYIKSHLARIKDRDKIVQAWVYLLDQARKLRLTPLNQRRSFHGILIGVKDIILTKGRLLLIYPGAS
jgi:Asp-tRNA(Asn)/Glu-tRNA(Gln) amidotransferase A subunit family amidase